MGQDRWLGPTKPGKPLTTTTTASQDLAAFKKRVLGTGTQEVPKGFAIDPTGAGLPIGGMAKPPEVQETPSEVREKSAPEMLEEYKQQVMGTPAPGPSIPEPGEELQYELRPVEKPMTSPRPIDKEFEERKRQQQKVQHLDQVLASLQKNRKGNYRPITIKDAVYIDSLSGSGGRDAYGKIVAYRGFILDKDYGGDDELMWTTRDPHSQEDIGLGYPRKIKDALKNIDELWEEESDRGGELWAQGFYDWGLIDSVESYLKRIRPTIQEGADEFEKIRQVSPVVEEVSAELLPGETFETSAIGKGRQSLFDPKLKEGRRLLIMSCCKAKTDDPGQIPALERYAGSLFQTLKTQGIPDDVDVAILSAKYGLMRINHPLSKYDKQMTKATQKKLLEDDEFIRLVQGTLEGYDDILVAGGKLYREPIRELSLRRDWFLDSRGTTEGTELPVPPGTITETVGTQGVQRQELKEWLRKSYGNDTLDEMIDELRGGKGPSKTKMQGLSLHEFARLKGIKKFSVEALGLEGELRDLDLESDRKPGQRRTIREDGMDLDSLATAASEAGYFGVVPDFEVRPGINELLELLDQSKRSPVYSEFEEDQELVDWESSLSDLDRQLTEMDIDLNQSNEAIRKQLEQSVPQEEIPFEIKTEDTPQGIQTLVEGVEPVTTQDLLEVEAKRPLRGGEAEAGPLFDVEGRAQTDLVEESRKQVQLPEEDVPYTESEEFLQHIAAVEAEERSERLALEERIASDPWHAGLPQPTQKERRNALTEDFDDLVSKSLRASRKGIFPEVNVGHDRLPKGIKGTGALTFYRGFPIQRVPIWDSDKKKEVQMYVVSSPEEYDIEIERLGLEGYRRKTVQDKSMREPLPPGRGILRRSLEGPLVKHKYEAIKQVDQLWKESPEAWNKVMKSLGYKYSDRHVFDAARKPEKKARGGFIDKPLYERTL